MENFKNLFLFLTIFFCFTEVAAQHLKFMNSEADFGEVESAAMLKTSFVFYNHSDTKTFIMRADAPKNILVQTSKKVIEPNDSASIEVTLTPTSKGKFSEKIKIYSSSDAKPYSLSIKGNLLILETDNLTSCVTFDPKSSPTSGSALIPVLSEQTFLFIDSVSGKKIENTTLTAKEMISGKSETFSSSSGILKSDILIGNYKFEAIADGYTSKKIYSYIGYKSGTHTFVLAPLKEQTEPPPLTYQDPKPLTEPGAIPDVDDTDDSELSFRKYNANNIIFLIDVSRSMRNEDRLPLLQKSIGRLLEPIRSIDYITVITYADGPKLLVPPQSGIHKKEIKEKVDSLVAKGSTSGSKGLQMAYELAESHYLINGNNQIIIASDGAFNLDNKDKKMISNAAESTDRRIIISAVAFGTHRTSLQMLKDIAELGKGSFLHLQNPETDIEALINEIKFRSAK